MQAAEIIRHLGILTLPDVYRQEAARIQLCISVTAPIRNRDCGFTGIEANENNF